MTCRGSTPRTSSRSRRPASITDGTNVSDSYWFVPKDLHKDAKFALEGYLYPDTYSFNKTDNEEDVINRMLDEFGTVLCPGPDDNPGAYFDDAKSCQAHMAKVGADNSTDILTVAKAKFFTDDPVEAIYKALTLASIVVRESGLRNDHDDRGKIADILYRRLLASQGKIKIPTDYPRWNLSLSRRRSDGLVRLFLGQQTNRWQLLVPAKYIPEGCRQG